MYRPDQINLSSSGGLDIEIRYVGNSKEEGIV